MHDFENFLIWFQAFYIEMSKERVKNLISLTR
ncbi:hypothetical protein BH23BAC1_BH23BAC1_26910 [soil metagenome]